MLLLKTTTEHGFACEHSVYDWCCVKSNNYTTVCLPVGGDNPQALASRVSPVRMDKPLLNYCLPPSVL